MKSRGVEPVAGDVLVVDLFQRQRVAVVSRRGRLPDGRCVTMGSRVVVAIIIAHMKKLLIIRANDSRVSDSN